MKSVRFFKFFAATVLVLFFSIATVTKAYDMVPGDTYRDLSPAYEPTVKSQTECELHPEWTYCKTGSLALATSINKLTMLLGGKPDVTVNGQTYKGDRGVIGFLSGQIAYITTTPVISGGDFVAYNMQRLTVPGVKPAYAAPGGIGGVGYRSLFPVLQLWTLMRNVAYLFFAVVFVIVGLLIILGKKLDPKTSLTIQAALPKIIISLILVSFSYAIAGFVIDIMYVAIALTFSVLGPLLDKGATPIVGGQKSLLDGIKNGEIIFAYFFRTPWLAAAGGVQTATQSLAEQIIKGLTLGVADGKDVITQALGFGAGILVNLILVIAVFYALFKIWLKLVMTYIQIILAVIVGPFLIMMDAIPKPNQSNFMNWLKGLLGNAMIYPVTIVMLLVGMLISAGVGQTGIGDGSFIAPLTGIGSAGVAQVIIGLGMLLSIPAILDKVPSWFGVSGKGGLAELGNAWAPAMAGAASFTAKNPVTKRLGRDREEWNAAEEGYKKKMREKQIVRRLGEKYGDFGAEAPQIDPAHLARAEDFKENLRAGRPGYNNYGFRADPKTGMAGTTPIADSEEWLKEFAGGSADRKKQMLQTLRGYASANDLTSFDHQELFSLASERAFAKATSDFYTKLGNQAAYDASEIAEKRGQVAERMVNLASNPVLGRASNILGYAAKPLEWISKVAGGK